MKTHFILLSTLTLLLASCGGGTAESGPNKTNEKSMEEVVPVVLDFKLNAAESKAEWERTLDQKPTKQKVNLFGQVVDVDLGAVKLNSNGSGTLKEGSLNVIEDALTEATVIFDMASFKFAKEKGNGLFDVTTHANSTLVLTDISNSKANGELIIQGTSKKMGVQVTSTKTKNGHTLSGSFIINTLDFPLRDKVTKKDINIDEIKVGFELYYYEK